MPPKRVLMHRLLLHSPKRALLLFPKKLNFYSRKLAISQSRAFSVWFSKKVPAPNSSIFSYLITFSSKLVLLLLLLLLPLLPPLLLLFFLLPLSRLLRIPTLQCPIYKILFLLFSPILPIQVIIASISLINLISSPLRLFLSKKYPRLLNLLDIGFLLRLPKPLLFANFKNFPLDFSLLLHCLNGNPGFRPLPSFLPFPLQPLLETFSFFFLLSFIFIYFFQFSTIYFYYIYSFLFIY